MGHSLKHQEGSKKASPKSESTPSGRPFRIIIVGGGVAGLALSHALVRVGIDHVVLEKGLVAPDWGSSISLWGNGSRILSQIGCFEALQAAALPLKMLHVRGPDGKAYNQEPYFDMMMERNGYECLTMERREFLRIIHAQHPAKEYIKEHSRVVDIVDGPDGVSVKLENGTVEDGDIVIGCDGVHSTIRELMWRNANASIPEYISTKEKRCLGINDMHWVTHQDLSFLILTQPDKIYFFVNWKMPQQSRWPTKAKWNNEEAEEAAASVLELPISDSAVFGELWRNKLRAHLIGLQEGTFEHWHFGRVALVGDSVHKVTPNFALGANCALESSASLLNEVYDLLATTKAGGKPTKEAISAAFRRYQQTREPRQKDAANASAFLTRIHAWDGFLNRFTMKYLWPIQGQGFYADKLADLCAGAPKFNFLPVTYKLPASYKWRDDAEASSQGKSRSGGVPGLVELVLIIGFFILAYFLTAGRST
ncbi:hypothetical protein NUW58_g2021 [Xylaria curta]|uniref:Uncharacterized protein n=1 Tax=Xylaria curta TaxID=42375 RepID=A0ACC1PHK9_9PEZI|nr:hypothetical protein NUW58_g2021 [Xylaria curta]